MYIYLFFCSNLYSHDDLSSVSCALLGVLSLMYHLCSYLLFYRMETGFSVLVQDGKSHALLILLVSVPHSSDVSLPYD